MFLKADLELDIERGATEDYPREMWAGEGDSDWALDCEAAYYATLSEEDVIVTEEP